MPASQCQQTYPGNTPAKQARKADPWKIFNKPHRVNTFSLSPGIKQKPKIRNTHPTETKTRDYYSDSQSRISKHQQRNTINNNQDRTSLLEPSYPLGAGTEYSNIAETQEKDLTIGCMKII